MKARDTRWMVCDLPDCSILSERRRADAAQKELQKLTVGYTPISGAAIPFFIAVEEKIFQKYGYRGRSGVFMGGSPLINSAILAGEFPIGYTGGGAIISSRLGGSDLIAIASPLARANHRRLGAGRRSRLLADLRGKRVGVTRFGASSYFAGLSMLESAGVKPNEVTFIQNGGVGESYAALHGRSSRRLHDRVPLRLARQKRRFPFAFPAVGHRIRPVPYGGHREPENPG